MLKNRILAGMGAIAAITFVLGLLAQTSFAHGLQRRAAESALAQTGTARVRIAHMVPDGTPVDVRIDDAQPADFRNIAFQAVTPYVTLTTGTHTFAVTPAGLPGPVVIDGTISVEAETDYTVVALNFITSIETLVLTDDNSLPPAGMAKFRIVQASPNAPPVDLALMGGDVILGNIPFKGVSTYGEVFAGTYPLELREAGTNNVLLSPPPVTLAADQVYTVFATDTVEDLDIVVTVDEREGLEAPDETQIFIPITIK